MNECKLAYGCLIEGGCETGKQKCDQVMELYDIAPTLEVMTERPYKIIKTVCLTVPIEGCDFGFLARRGAYPDPDPQ